MLGVIGGMAFVLTSCWLATPLYGERPGEAWRTPGERPAPPTRPAPPAEACTPEPTRLIFIFCCAAKFPFRSRLLAPRGEMDGMDDVTRVPPLPSPPRPASLSSFTNHAQRAYPTILQRKSRGFVLYSIAEKDFNRFLLGSAITSNTDFLNLKFPNLN